MTDGRRDTVLVTGGAGFIGSALVRRLIDASPYRVVNVDKLTYAGDLESVAEVADDARYAFEQADVCDAERMRQIFAVHRPGAVLHLAAESHVDRSIDGPAEFIRTNVVGTFTLLQAARGYVQELPAAEASSFRFVHVSTDEVFGSLGEEGRFDEATPYAPRSPYAASKASADHLARAWHHTSGLPVIVTNCSNNSGPYQFPEKLIPVVILRALRGETIPVYGTGGNVRDWLYVEDHARALHTVLERGAVGETYNIGGDSERTNLEVAHAVCALLDELVGPHEGRSRAELIRFVADRPGHDWRYAIDARKVARELGWRPEESFESGLRKTVAWYHAHPSWCERILSGAYRLERLGLGAAAE